MVVLAVLALLAWLYLAVAHGAFWRLLVMPRVPEPTTWPSVDIIVPARNEAEVLSQSLASLLMQNYPGAWRVLLVDDHSTDGTGDVARNLAKTKGREQNLTVVSAPDLPAGWVGKVAAMQAGVAQSRADYILFTDADIEHPVHSLRRLVSRAQNDKLDLVSEMVRLNCRSVAEKLLIPAFVFFFAMLYPFRRANNPRSRVAAAAGGVMLVRRQALDNAGGLVSIKGAVIDDCALAAIIKRAGGGMSAPGSIQLSLSNDVYSLRPYPELRDIWGMVARTAFTQLKYSPWLLAGAVIGMLILFLAPVIAPLFGNLYAVLAGLTAWAAMTLLYMPMIDFYRLPKIWVLTLPLAGVIYTAATFDSARLYWQGKGGQWKGRAAAEAQQSKLELR